jgi:hypothetical protein
MLLTRELFCIGPHAYGVHWIVEGARSGGCRHLRDRTVEGRTDMKATNSALLVSRIVGASC